MAAYNVGDSSCRPWCEEVLRRLFDDDDEKVRQEAVSCFQHLEHAEIESYARLIEACISSKAFGGDLHWLLNALERATTRLPGVTIKVCDQYLARFGTEAGDWASRRAHDAYAISTLAFRTYQQHPNDEWTRPALDLIDTLSVTGVGDAAKQFEAFDR